MFIERFTVEQQENYFREFYWEEGFDDYEITGISCDPSKIYDDWANASCILTCVLEKRDCDEDGILEKSKIVRDFEPGMKHLRFMLDAYGGDYYFALCSYAKRPEGRCKYSYNELKECGTYLKHKMLEGLSTITLDKFMDTKKEHNHLDEQSTDQNFEMSR